MTWQSSSGPNRLSPAFPLSPPLAVPVLPELWGFLLLFPALCVLSLAVQVIAPDVRSRRCQRNIFQRFGGRSIKVWLVCFWRIRYRPVSSYCLLLGLASSSEDEYESLIVREECGWDDEWSDILRSRGEGRQWKILGAPLSPSWTPWMSSLWPPVELLPGSVAKRSYGSHHGHHL